MVLDARRSIQFRFLQTRRCAFFSVGDVLSVSCFFAPRALLFGRTLLSRESVFCVLSVVGWSDIHVASISVRVSPFSVGDFLSVIFLLRRVHGFSVGHFGRVSLFLRLRVSLFGWILLLRESIFSALESVFGWRFQFFSCAACIAFRSDTSVA